MKIIRAKSFTDYGLSAGYQSSLAFYTGRRHHVLFVRFGWWLVNIVIK